jgi:threonine/homoserine/homoserine lactone efflux protein
LNRQPAQLVVLALVAPIVFVGAILLGLFALLALFGSTISVAQWLSGAILGWIGAQIAVILIIRREVALARLLRDKQRDAEQDQESA